MSRLTDAFGALNGGKWTIIAAAFALVGFGAATAKTVKSVSGIPAQLAMHDSNTVKLTEAVHELTRVQTEQLCITVAQLSHEAWEKCVLP